MSDLQRSGAHRPPRSPLTGLVPMALIVLTVVAVAIGAWQLNRYTASSVTPSPSSSRSEVPADVPPAPGQSVGPTPSGTSGGSPSGSPEPSATGASTRGADGDRSMPVTVHNGTQRTGLAGATAARLEELGWPASVGADESPASATTVYYPRPSLRDMAQLVADDLGGSPLLEESTRYGSEQVTVVLGPDATG